MNEFLKLNNKKCSCGKTHSFDVDKIYTGSGAIKNITSVIKEYNAKKAFVFGDKNTFRAAGEQICLILDDEKINFTSYVLDEEMPEPDEKTVGSVIMHYDHSCDIIIGVGSGVVNDVGKILAATTGKPYVEKICNIYPDAKKYVILPIFRGLLEEKGKNAVMSFDEMHILLAEICKSYDVEVIDGMKLVPHRAEFFKADMTHPDEKGFLHYGNNLLKGISK